MEVRLPMFKGKLQGLQRTARNPLRSISAWLVGVGSGNRNRPRHHAVVTLGLACGLHAEPKPSRYAERDVGHAPPAIRLAQIGAVLDDSHCPGKMR